MLVEDVKIGVILALAPSQVQIHCNLNSHTLRSCSEVRTLLFEYCRAQTDLASGGVVPLDFLDVGQRRGQEG